MSIEDNKEFVRRYNDVVWNAHDPEKSLEFLDDEQSVNHVRQFLVAFPDVQVTIYDMIAEGDKVVARIRATATNTGPFAGNPPTGKKVEIHSIRIYQIVDDKIVDTWAMQDRLGLMEQLGLVQSAGGKVNWADGKDE